MQDNEALLTPRETAQLLKVNVQTVHNMRRNGILKGFPIGTGRQFRYRKSDILAYLDKAETAPKE